MVRIRYGLRDIGGRSMKEQANQTQDVDLIRDTTLEVPDILEQVYAALSEKGYNPVNQIVGYIMSGDPTYITSHRNARSLIMKAERDEIIEVLMENYIETRLK
jgi:uncharacterized protein (UPF0297 family)